MSKEGGDNICSLTIDGETIPLFITPVEQTDGHLKWIVECNNNKYACLSTSNNKILVGFNIFKELGKTLAGCYDDYYLNKDEVRDKLRLIPVVDILEEGLISIINNIVPDTITHFTWPDNHTFAMVLTHDVDRFYKTYQYLISILNSML